MPTTTDGGNGNGVIRQRRNQWHARERHRESWEADRGHLADVERKIADLTALQRELNDLIGQCRHGTVAECRIIEALSPG